MHLISRDLSFCLNFTNEMAMVYPSIVHIHSEQQQQQLFTHIRHQSFPLSKYYHNSRGEVAHQEAGYSIADGVATLEESLTYTIGGVRIWNFGPTLQEAALTLEVRGYTKK